VRKVLVEEVRAREILSHDRSAPQPPTAGCQISQLTRLSASSHAFFSSVRFALFTFTTSEAAGDGAGAAMEAEADMGTS
jgi:hypothetical protein